MQPFYAVLVVYYSYLAQALHKRKMYSVYILVYRASAVPLICVAASVRVVVLFFLFVRVREVAPGNRHFTSYKGSVLCICTPPEFHS